MQASNRIADVLIIGGGIAGCSTAYYLARAGCRVTLLEKGLIGHEASGRNVGAIRQQMRHPLELPVVLEGGRRWPLLDEELGMETDYRMVGNVMSTYREEEVEAFQEEVERQRPLGLGVQLLSGRELKDVVPGLSDAIVAGMYSPTDGQANPHKTTLAFATAARRLGARVLPGVEVSSILVEGDRVQGVRIAGGDLFAAGTVLIAAGVGSPALAAPLGVQIPVVPWRLQPLITAPAPRVTHAFLRCSGPRMAIGQTLEGTVVAALGPPERVSLDPSVTVERLSRDARELGRILPPLAGVRVVRAWMGWFEVTPDDLPLMGPVEGIGGLFVATGFSGHGFSHGPAIGALMSELMLEGRTSVPIDGFRLSRFREPGYGKEAPEGKLARLWANTAANAE